MSSQHPAAPPPAVVDAPAARPRTKRGEARRKAMIAAATEVFLEHGFDRASLDMVMERAGGSRGTLYAQFGGKEGLFVAVVTELLSGVLSALHTLEGEEEGPEETLVAMGVRFARAITQPRVAAVFRLFIHEAHRFPELGARFFSEGPEQAYGTVAKTLRRLDAAHHLGFSDVEASARILVEMMKGELHLKAMLASGGPSDGEIEAHVRRAVRIFLYGASQGRRSPRQDG